MGSGDQGSASIIRRDAVQCNNVLTTGAEPEVVHKWDGVEKGWERMKAVGRDPAVH
jgi:hypothetical protein